MTDASHPPDSGPLSSTDKAALDSAAERVRVLLKPARWATVNVWTVGVFGVLTLIYGLASGTSAVLVGLGLVLVAWNERRGRDLLRAIDPRGPTVLGWSELALGAVIAASCLLAILKARAAPDPSLVELSEAAGISLDELAGITTRVYGALIVGVVIAQALVARYHFRNRPKVEQFRRETPPWVLEILRATSAPPSPRPRR